ncbi:MAG: T9SS type B sorting domain-containing protein, partial [Paludibacteraceae bacterium]|nr:T9SS type B sorting domain-containing protein [Paludibacteraceae bacterium]
GTNVSLQATVSGTPESVKWEKTVGGQTSLLANALTANDVPTQASEYTVTASGKYCPSVNQSVSVAVDTKAVLTLNTSADAVCVNGEVTLTADYGTATAIVWEQKTESDADFTEFATDLATQKAIHPAGKTSYRIRSTQGGACPESVSDIITIDTEDSLRMDLQPIAEQVKEGESVTLKATITTGTPTSFTWEKESSSNKSTLSTNYETTDTPSENCTYIATVHAKHCPDVSKSQSILFKPQIILSLTSVVDTICEGEEVILTASYGEAESIVWEMQEDGETNYADFATDLTTQKSINPIVTTHYRIRTTGDDAVYSNVVTIHVEKPVEIELTGDESVCKGSDYTINFHVTNGQDLSSLILYETVNSKTIKQENIEIFNLNDYNGSYHYTLKEETSFNLKAIPNHCYEVETTHIVKIDTVPTLYELTASVDSICRGEYVDISTDFPFSEDNLLLTALTIRTNEQEESYMISTKERLNPNETTYYTLTPRTEKGCIGEKKGITIYVSEPIEITTKDTTVCTGEKAVLHVDKESSKEQYIWSISPEFTDTIATGNNQRVHPEETTTYYVKAINGKCEKELEQTVYIAPRPSILVSQEEARTIHLEGVGGTGDYWYDYGSGYEQTNEIAHAVPNKTYTIKIKDEAGCINDTTFTVQPYDLIIPEYFTPQSDGCNDTWKIINLNKYTRVNVTIYDRYGKILFEAKTPDQEWDGTYNGYALPSEDYWYVVKVYDIGAIYSGHFTLIR